MADYRKLGYKTEWSIGPGGFERYTPSGNFQSFGFASEQGKRIARGLGLPDEVTMDARQRAYKKEMDAFRKYEAAVQLDRDRRAAVEEQAFKADVRDSIQKGRPVGRFAPRSPGTAIIPDPENPLRQIEVQVGESSPGATMKDIMGMARSLGYYKDEQTKTNLPRKQVLSRYYNGSTNQWMQVFNDGTESALPGQISHRDAVRNMKDFKKELDQLYEDQEYSDMEREHDAESKATLDENAAALGLKINWKHTAPEKRKLGGVVDFLRKDVPESWRIRNISISSNHDMYDEGGGYATIEKQQDPTVRVVGGKPGEEVTTDTKKEQAEQVKFSRDEKARALAIAWQQLGKGNPWGQASEAEKNEARQLAETYLNKGMI